LNDARAGLVSKNSLPLKPIYREAPRHASLSL
jgi:hypothetical protein